MIIVRFPSPSTRLTRTYSQLRTNRLGDDWTVCIYAWVYMDGRVTAMCIVYAYLDFMFPVVYVIIYVCMYEFNTFESAREYCQELSPRCQYISGQWNDERCSVFCLSRSNSLLCAEGEAALAENGLLYIHTVHTCIHTVHTPKEFPLSIVMNMYVWMQHHVSLILQFAQVIIPPKPFGLQWLNSQELI